MAFTATYAPQEQTIEKPLYAAVADTMIIKRADGKANVKYIAKLSIPDNYILNETGLLWYGKPDLEIFAQRLARLRVRRKSLLR